MVFEADGDFGACEKRNAIDMSIARVGDLLISGYGLLRRVASGEWGMNSASAFFRQAGRSIYLWGFKKATGEFGGRRYFCCRANFYGRDLEF